VVAAVAAAPAAAALAHRAQSARALVGAAVYGASLVLLFSVSALYHRVFWPDVIRRHIGRLDHSAIFILIAGTYTPFCLLLGPGKGDLLMALVWAGAILGILVVVLWAESPKSFRASLYVVLGWFVIPVVPALHAALGGRALALLIAGGFFYTVGAILYALRRPDPFPTVFGFHEVFHLLTIVAAVCHFLVVDAAVRVMG
jgi:hemolysin III